VRFSLLDNVELCLNAIAGAYRFVDRRKRLRLTNGRLLDLTTANVE
jgi:hypothetical protein